MQVPNRATGMHSTATVGEVDAPFTANIVVSMGITANAPVDAKLQCAKQYTGEPTRATYVESGAITAIKLGAVESR